MLVDVLGFLPGTDQNTTVSSGGAVALRLPARPPCQRSRSSPASTYGGAYCVMGSKDMSTSTPGRPRSRSRWMAASGAVGCALAEAAANGEDIDKLRLRLQCEYEDTLVNLYVAERGISTR